MSRPASESARFHRDVRLARKKGKDLSKLRAAMDSVIEEMPMPARLRDHPLKGNLAGYRECHIEPDWLLIYQIDALTGGVRFERTGTHSDLFG